MVASICCLTCAIRGLDLRLLAGAFNHRGGFLVDDDFLGPPELVDLHALELHAQVLRDELSARQNRQVLEHGFATVAESRGLDGADMHHAAEPVDDQRGQGLVLHVLGHDQQRLAQSRHLLQDGDELPQVGDLLLMNQDVGLLQHALHCVLFIAYASLAPGVSDRIDPLIPALQSNWLHAHVITCFLSYSSFALSCAVSVMYLLKLRKKEKGQKEAGLIALFPSLDALDTLVYKTIVVGFPLLTIGIVTGAAWANYAWGSYWSWDPKETWSLITWFVYAIFLHARFAREWRGKRTAALSIIGFLAVIFTYFGVNYVLSGLHSYA